MGSSKKSTSITKQPNPTLRRKTPAALRLLGQRVVEIRDEMEREQAASKAREANRKRVEKLLNMGPAMAANPIVDDNPDDAIHRALCVLRFVKRSLFTVESDLDLSDDQNYGGSICMDLAIDAIERTTNALTTGLRDTQDAALLLMAKPA